MTTDDLTPDLGDAQSGLETESFDAGEATASAASASPASDWYTRPYQKANPIGPAKLPRPLYAPGNPSGHKTSAPGPDAIAIKRTLSRLGRWPWQPFDDVYNKPFAIGAGPNVIDSGVAGFQRQEGIADTGQLGDKAWQAMRRAIIPPEKPHGGEYGLDATSIRLLADAQALIDAKPVYKIEDVRAEIAAYCRDSLANAPKIRYQQVRPIACFGVPPAQGFTTDCSGHSTCCYFWPRHALGVAVPDPNHRGFDGYGYTGTLIENPTATGTYQIGDLGIYGPSRGASSHVVTCYVAGDASRSLWLSHGSDDAPYSVNLHYRSDLLVVVRPKLMP